jgi:hypothetical protein
MTLKEQGNLNAFPMRNPDPNQDDEFGLTKREYFAAMALQGLLTTNDLTLQECAKSAVHTADLLIAELNK